jgi:hypothetical protein
MWLEDFNPPVLDDDGGIRIHESRCAGVLKQKVAIYKDLLDIMDYMDNPGNLLGELLLQVEKEEKAREKKKKPKKEKDPAQYPLLIPGEESSSAGKQGSAPPKTRGRKKGAPGTI